MKPRLCRTPEGLVIRSGETVAIEPPLIGCFVTAGLYSFAAVVTHCGPGMNDLTCKYHRKLRPESAAPARVVFLSLDLSTTTYWQRYRAEYETFSEELVAQLAIALQIYPHLIERGVYTTETEVMVELTAAGNLAIQI